MWGDALSRPTVQVWGWWRAPLPGKKGRVLLCGQHPFLQSQSLQQGPSAPKSATQSL